MAMLDDNNVPTAKSAALWRVTEINLESVLEHGNPYADTEVTVSFHGPGGETIHRPAFWDGGRTWKVRFAPTAPGRWRWTSVCSNTHDEGLHGVAGELTAVAVETAVPLHRHGFLRFSENNRRFVHADGTPAASTFTRPIRMPPAPIGGQNHSTALIRNAFAPCSTSR